MSRDKLFFLCRDFSQRYPQLTDKVYIALQAAIEMCEKKVKQSVVEDRLSFGLNLLLMIDKKEHKE